MNQKGLVSLLIVILIALAVGGYLVYQRQTKITPSPQPTTQPTPQPSPSPASARPAPTGTRTVDVKLSKKEIPRICGDMINYQTGLEVQNEVDAQNAFLKYINYMKANKLQDSNLAVDWTFTKADYAGYYQNLPYWVITFGYTMASGEKGNSQTYVSQKGDVVQLLGCI